MISRRGFLGALAGLIAAPSLIEKLKTWDHRTVKLVKMQGTVELSGAAMQRMQASEGAFVEWAEKALDESARRRMAELNRMYGA